MSSPPLKYYPQATRTENRLHPAEIIIYSQSSLEQSDLNILLQETVSLGQCGGHSSNLVQLRSTSVSTPGHAFLMPGIREWQFSFPGFPGVREWRILWGTDERKNLLTTCCMQVLLLIFCQHVLPYATQHGVYHSSWIPCTSPTVT